MATRSIDPLAEGQAALARTDWAGARAHFQRALDGGAGPEALEGLATAAWFVDDSDVVFPAREQAYAGYREAGRPVDAARVAIALAWDYRIFRGEPSIGDGWLGRARRLLGDADPCPEQGWLALREAAFLLPRDIPRGRELCAEAEALGREIADLDLEMTAVALDGLARVSAGDIASGMARLDEASAAAAAGELHDPLAIGWSCCYLIFACERVRDFDRAGQWCERLAGMASAGNDEPTFAMCRAHFGTVLVLRGEWERAEAELTAAAAGSAPRPRVAADALARLGDLRRRQGRTEEAAALLQQAELSPLAMLFVAALALERGDTDDACDTASRYLRLIGDADTERAPGLELLAQARAQAGRVEEAAACAAELRRIADGAATDALRGAASHAEGVVHVAAADLDAARESFEDAVGLLGRAGLPFEAASARNELAAVLSSLGREDAARRERARAREQLHDLGVARTAGPRGRGDLTRREREVLGLVAQGQTNAQIAEALVLSEHTVHRHVANILAKLGTSSRAAAAAAAVEQGLL